jgi:hypothetical protein
MVAKYKEKRLLIENSIDAKPRRHGYHVEGSERARGKRESRSGRG